MAGRGQIPEKNRPQIPLKKSDTVPLTNGPEMTDHEGGGYFPDPGVVEVGVGVSKLRGLLGICRRPLPLKLRPGELGGGPPFNLRRWGYIGVGGMGAAP